MILENVSIDDAKAISLSHESRIERKRQTNISPLPSVNLSVITATDKNQNIVQNSHNSQAQASLQQHIDSL